MTDPRIHERRVSVARERGRRRRHRILAGLGAAVLGTASLWLVHSSVLGARDVQVSGAQNIARARVIAAAGLQGAPPLVDLSPATISSRVEQLPWVLTAGVRIAWPWTVAIRVTERTPVAAVAIPGTSRSFAVCDVTGRVLEIVPARPASLPLVAIAAAPAGKPGAPGSFLPVGDRLELEVAAAMPESLVGATTWIGLSSAGVVVGLDHRLLAIFGQADLLSQKFVSLVTVLAHGGLGGVSAIDLRVPAAPVLLPQGSGPIVPGIVGG